MSAPGSEITVSRPNVELGLIEVDPPLALPGLIDGDFDLALVYDYPMLGAAPPVHDLSLVDYLQLRPAEDSPRS